MVRARARPGVVHQALECRALQVARRRTHRGVAQGVAQSQQPAHGGVELIGLGRQRLAIDHRCSAAPEHRGDLVEGKTRGLPQADQRQPVQHAGVEDAPQPPPPAGFDQSALFVEAQRRGGYTAAPGHLGDVHADPLDLKST